MGSEFIAEGIVVAGISLGVVVSLIISILKKWLKLEGKVITSKCSPWNCCQLSMQLSKVP